MSGVTSPLSFPFPTGTDRVMDGDDAIKALAEKVDDYLAPSGTVTPVGISSLNGWGVASTTIRRFGPFVVMHFDVTKASWVASEGIGVVPTGYRPGGTASWLFGAVVGASGGMSSVSVAWDGTIITVLGSSNGAGLLGTFIWFAAV